MRYAKAHQFGPVESVQLGVGYFGPPPVQVYAFWVDGLLIDTGPPMLQNEFMAWLKKRTLEQVFITHHHEDHSGNVNAVAAHANVPIQGSPLCCDLVQGKVHTCLAQKLFWGSPQFTDKVTPIDGESIETNRHRFSLISVPGHSADQVALFEPKEGWLFSADVFVSPIIKYFMRQESMREQMDSLKKLIALDFDQMFCCHKPQMKGGKKLLKQKLAFFEDYYGQVLHWADKGYSPQAIRKAMNQQERWSGMLLSGGKMSAVNMIRAVLRDEGRSR